MLCEKTPPKAEPSPTPQSAPRAGNRCARRDPAGLLRRLRQKLHGGRLCIDSFQRRAARVYRAAGLPLRAAMLAENPDGELQTLTDAPPACTLTMMVRDEEENIVEALDSVDLLFDEMVICDTGSQDATVDRARRYGVRMSSRPWDDDFSAPRNQAIDASRGEWIFWMDADDRLVESEPGALRRVWLSSPPACYLLTVINRIGSSQGSSFLQARLFPRLPTVRFERRIHEQIIPSLQRAAVPFRILEEVVVEHHGYGDAQTARCKSERNARMIRRELACCPDDPLLLLSLGDALFVKSDWTGACEVYRRLAQLPNLYARHADVWGQAHYNLALTLLRTANPGEARVLLHRVVDTEPDRIEAWYRLGCLYKERLQRDHARFCFERALGQTPRLRTTAANNEQTQRSAVTELSAVLLEEQNWTAGLTWIARGLERWPGDNALLILQGTILLHQRDLAGATRCFMRVLEQTQGRSIEALRAMSTVYTTLGDNTKSAEFTAVANRLSETLSAMTPAPHPTTSP